MFIFVEYILFLGMTYWRHQMLTSGGHSKKNKYLLDSEKVVGYRHFSCEWIIESLSFEWLHSSSFWMISFDFILNDFLPFHFEWFHSISFWMISFHFILNDFIWFNSSTFWMISFHFISNDFIWFHSSSIWMIETWMFESLPFGWLYPS